MYFNIYSPVSMNMNMINQLSRSIVASVRANQPTIIPFGSLSIGFSNYYNPVVPSYSAVPSNYSEIRRYMSNFVKSLKSTGTKIYDAGAKVCQTISNFGKSIVDVAKSYKGYNEANGSYKLFTDGRTEAWCADFVSYCARKCGVKDFNFRGVQGILDWGKRNNRFSRTPKVGDAIIFKGWDSKRGTYASHTGIVTRIENGRVYTIEGNTSDRVDERNYDLNDSKITGYVTIA